ncbi:MAG: hypothetical protein BroJett025_07140 [Patescibacteria group bacterium]|nr:MAG: hypothetical protein BroJett025_07140 [Patescibacteria group bacterium]
MDLPNLFSSSAKTTTEELVLFLIISDSKLQVSLLELSSGGVQIVSKSKVFDYEGLEKCVLQTDLALQQLDKKSDKVSEIIFAVNSSWVNNGEVVDEKKPIIKKLTDELNLNPLGFIDVNESIAQQKIAENSLFSGIIVLITKSELLFTLVYQGKIKKTEIVGSSADFQSDFTEGVGRIQKIIEKQGNYIPPKLVLASFELSDVELHEKQQAVYNQDWEANKVFLQTPTVETVTQDRLLVDLSKEAGKNAAVHKGLTDFALAASVGSVKESSVDTLDSSEFGFSDPLEESPPTSFGIPIKSSQPELAIERESDENVTAVDENFMREGVKEIVLDKKEKPKRDWGHKKNVKWFAILGVILGLLVLYGILALGSSFVAKTAVDVTLNKKLVSKDIELTLDTKASQTDVEKLLIAAETVTKKASDTSTMQTTGIKIVGENAKGKVAVYNKTTEVKTFDKGTQLKYNDLIFVLDEQITVASASDKPGGKDYGKQETTITASQIGAEGNLKKDTELTIASYDTSSYNAFVIDEDLAGGSSREVRVVAQKDLDELLKDLKEELLKKINDEFAAESGNGTYILPSKSIINEKAKYNSELEKEAESLSLELEIEVEAVTYSGGDLKPVAQEILSKELPENYELEDADPQILSSPSQTDLDKLESEAVVSIEANISAYAIPKLSEDSLKSEIAGKSFSEATEILNAKEEISSVSFKTVPGLLSAFVKKVASSADRILIQFIK